VDAREGHHKAVSAAYRNALRSGRRFVTTNMTLAELVALLASRRRMPRASVLQFLTDIRTSPNVDLIVIDDRLDAAAWELLTSRPDKGWSLVDCASFVVMREMGIVEALATDRHFEQAGFMTLPK
jgi:predicted nucleic acid-binding protein